MKPHIQGRLHSFIYLSSMYKEVIWIQKTNNKNNKHDALFKVELSGVVKVL